MTIDHCTKTDRAIVLSADFFPLSLLFINQLKSAAVRFVFRALSLLHLPLF
jgi:hypothetical protein